MFLYEWAHIMSTTKVILPCQTRDYRNELQRKLLYATWESNPNVYLDSVTRLLGTFQKPFTFFSLFRIPILPILFSLMLL